LLDFTGRPGPQDLVAPFGDSEGRHNMGQGFRRGGPAKPPLSAETLDVPTTAGARALGRWLARLSTGLELRPTIGRNPIHPEDPADHFRTRLPGPNAAP
jgi:hypothetical protein